MTFQSLGYRTLPMINVLTSPSSVWMPPSSPSFVSVVSPLWSCHMPQSPIGSKIGSRTATLSTDPSCVFHPTRPGPIGQVSSSFWTPVSYSMQTPSAPLTQNMGTGLSRPSGTGLRARQLCSSPSPTYPMPSAKGFLVSKTSLLGRMDFVLSPRKRIAMTAESFIS